MSLSRSPRGAVAGLVAGLLVMFVLNLLIPGNGMVVAQDETPTETPLPPTSTPTLTPTPLPVFQLQASAVLLPEGDMDANGMINPGDIMLYTITLTNAGDAFGPVQIVANFDKTFISGVANISVGGAAGESQVVWNVDQIPAVSETTLTFQATLKRVFPPGRTQVTGAVVVMSGAVELGRITIPAFEVNGPNLRLVDTTVELITDSDVNGRIDPGDAVRFTISYANTGGGPSPEATIVASYPVDLTREITANPDNASLADGSLVWAIGSVPSTGEVRSVQFAVALQGTFPAGITSYDLVTALNAADGTLDQRTFNVQVSGPSPVATASYAFVADNNSNSLLDVGDQARVDVRYDNVGTDSIANVSLVVTYDTARFEILQVSEGGTHTPEEGKIVWLIPVLAPNAPGTVNFIVSLRSMVAGAETVTMDLAIGDDQSRTSSQISLPVNPPTPTPEPSPTPESIIQEIRPAQGSGILPGSAVAALIGAFLFLSLLALAFVASRVLPGTAEERAEVDSESEQAAQRRLVRELIEGVVLTAILFAVMVLGIQNSLDQDSVNSIIAGIVGYVAGRVSSQK